jgi:hypothetical protein
MKKIISALALLFAFSLVHAEGEVQKACVKNEKTGKEVCKQIKVHKKLEVEPVPAPAQKKK